MLFGGVAYAQDMTWFDAFFFGTGGNPGIETVISGYIVPTVLVMGVAVFVWGAFLFILHGDDEKLRSEGRQRMMWGVVGIFTMIAVWGLVNLLREFVGVGDGPQYQATGFTVGGATTPPAQENANPPAQDNSWVSDFNPVYQDTTAPPTQDNSWVTDLNPVYLP